MGEKYSAKELMDMTPREFRAIIRTGEVILFTDRVCRGYATANMVALPKEFAYDFMLFCIRNPRVSPLLEVTDVGDPHPKRLAPEADLRTDIALYRVFKNGELIDEPTDVVKYWKDDMVGFLIGCTSSWGWVLNQANIHYRNGGVRETNLQCVPAGCFHGPIAATCRLVQREDVSKVVEITSRHKASHGPPLHIGDPTKIGIFDLTHKSEELLIQTLSPVVNIEENEVPMFWPVGLTPELVAREANIPLMIMHHKAETFITDLTSEELALTW
ncbi:D-glutamate cyclase family protein [Chloroflexota bacterium]